MSAGTPNYYQNYPAQPAAPAPVPVQGVEMAPGAAPVPTAAEAHHETPEIRIYSHSMFFYWWPVWVTSAIMSMITWLDHTTVMIGNTAVWFPPYQIMGVIFLMVLFAIILTTNITLRGQSSIILIVSLALAAVVLAYFGLWEWILSLVPLLSIHMNLGFYASFTIAMFAIWAFATFVYDHTSFWTIRAGQLIHQHVIGGGERSYDTRGMVFEKKREDLFRQWIIGMGSGDLQIITTGARREVIEIPNVLFIDSKLTQIQKMIAERPTGEDMGPPPPPLTQA